MATYVPNAPSNCSATRNSDYKATVSWTNGAITEERPRGATYIERSTDGGTWTQLDAAAYTATSYVDQTITTNHRYAYRVRARNAVGWSGYSTSGYIYTTPAAPTSVTANKTTATTVEVSITGAATYATGYDVAVTDDNGSTWSTLASNTAMPYTDSNLPAGTIAYRVRSVRSSLASAWVESSSISTLVAPDAPTITAQPSNPTVLGSTVIISWTPNHPDGTAQTKAQVEVTDPSSTVTTHAIADATATYSFAVSTAGTWSARVRTYGLYAGWGAWSENVTWGVYAAPIVTITDPATDGATVTALPFTVAWSVTDSTGVGSQTVTIKDDDTGSVLYRSSVASGTTSLSLGVSDVPTIANSTSYTISVAVTGGSGLSASAAREFSTSWASPITPTTIINNDADTLATSVTVFAGVNPNLLPTFTTRTLNGVTFTANDDGSVTLTNKATSTANATWPAWTPPVTGTYTLSGCPSGGGATSVQMWIYDNTTSATAGIEDTGSGDTGTLDSTHEYSIRIRVQSGYTCSGETFYPQLEYGSTATEYVPYATPATDSLMVTRTDAEGNVWVVGDGLATGASVTDPLPPLNTAYTYTITAVAASGATSTKTVSNTIEPPGWVLNFGNQAAFSYTVQYNVKSSYSLKHGGDAYHFADGGAGNGLPVWYGTTDRDMSGSISFTAKELSDVDNLHSLSLSYPVAWIRDPLGHRWRAHVLMSVSRDLNRVWDMSLSWNAVRFQEAW